MYGRYLYPVIVAVILSGGQAYAQKSDTLRRKDVNGWEFVQVRSYNKVVAEGYLSNGQKEGVWTEFHPTFYPSSTTTYLHGKKDGVAMSISAAGQVLSVENYKGDKREGPYRLFNSEGTGVLEEAYYSEGQKHGAYTKWYPNGNKQETGTYRYDKREGKSLWYYENGSLAADYNYTEGEIDGDVSTFYKGGKLSAYGPYKKGEQTGTWKEYYENGNLKAEGQYKDGNKEGEWKNYDEKGKPIKSTTYIKGETK
jgi:antitoxin component YwqK of YwqJK toxin-antitoxin module